MKRATALWLEYELGEHDQETSSSRNLALATQDGNDLVEWAEEEAKLKDYTVFFRKYAQYYSSKLSEYPKQKLNALLDKYPHRFGPRSSQALVNEQGEVIKNPGYIGRVFEGVYGGIKRELEKKGRI